MEKKIAIKCCCKNKEFIPFYATQGSAGADIFACIDSDETIKPGERKLISTGLVFEIPQGYEVQIRPRSGLAAKYGVTLVNTPGTIDSDYRGEIKIIMINHGHQDFVVKNGDRIAQMVAAPVVQAEFVEAELSATERGKGGFGSTGV